MLGEGVQHQQVVRLEPGRAEHRDPLGQVAALGRRAQHGGRDADSLDRVGQVQLSPQSPPELGLPGPVGRQRLPGRIDIAARGPAGDHGRAPSGVRGEQVGQMPRRRPPAATAYRVGLGRSGRPAAVAEIAPEQTRPGLAPALVDHPQQRPDQAGRRPRVDLVRRPGRGDRPRDQPARRRESHPGADAVGLFGGGAELMGQPLRQPALDPGRRHADDLGGERIGQRRAQHLAQGLDEAIGALGPMEMQ